LPIIVERGGERIPAVVTPELDPKAGLGLAGWAERADI
jgi:hypothetical protein